MRLRGEHRGRDAAASRRAPRPTTRRRRSRRCHTPDLPGIDGVAKHLGVERSDLLKCIAFDVDGEVGLALVPGDREVNEFARARAASRRGRRASSPTRTSRRIPSSRRATSGRTTRACRYVVADRAVRAPRGWITGANEIDHHVRDAWARPRLHVDEWGDIVTIVTGRPVSRTAGSRSRVDRGIEVGQVFQLGTKYAEALGAFYTDEDGAQHPMVMGCYGIGISRVVAAIVEEHHDDNGIVVAGRGRAVRRAPHRDAGRRDRGRGRRSCTTSSARRRRRALRRPRGVAPA